MLEQIHFKNLDEIQEELSRDFVSGIFYNIDIRTEVFFERTTRGQYRGRIVAKSKWGKTFADAEGTNLREICHNLKNKIQSRVYKQKSLFRSETKKNPFRLPAHDFVKSDAA